MRLQHPVLDELSNLLYRQRTMTTPHGLDRIQRALIDLDNMYTFVAELGGLEAVRDAATKKKK